MDIDNYIHQKPDKCPFNNCFVKFFDNEICVDTVMDDILEKLRIIEQGEHGLDPNHLPYNFPAKIIDREDERKKQQEEQKR